MVHYSVLIPERDAAEDVCQRLPQLCQVLDDLLLPYEIICIDDASPQPAAQRLQELLGRYARLRVLRFDEPRGTAAGLTAGLAAATGRILIAMDVRDPHAPLALPQLISRLSRYDLAVTHRQHSLVHDLWQSYLRRTRLLLRSPRLHDRESLLWATKRAAVQGLTFPRGSFRLIEALVARRGQRVCRVTQADGLLPSGVTYRAGLFDRLAAWWLSRRYEPHLASELRRDSDDGGSEIPASVPPRLDVALPRPIPQPLFQPVEKKQRDSD